MLQPTGPVGLADVRVPQQPHVLGQLVDPEERPYYQRGLEIMQLFIIWAGLAPSLTGRH